MTAAIIGAFARVELDTAQEARHRLAELAGVELFDLDEPGKVGLIIEAEDLDEGHAKLTGEIRRTEGVMGVWPVYVNFDVDDESDRQEIESAVRAGQDSEGDCNGIDPS